MFDQMNVYVKFCLVWRAQREIFEYLYGLLQISIAEDTISEVFSPISPQSDWKK